MFRQTYYRPFQRLLLIFPIIIILLILKSYMMPASEELVYSSMPDAPLHLREFADDIGIRVGVVDTNEFGSNLYLNTVPNKFDSVTPENKMKFKNIHPCPPPWLVRDNSTVFTWVIQHGSDRPEPYSCTISNVINDEWEWDGIDQLISWADANNIGFRGHTFLWHSQNPGWLTSSDVTLSIAERERIMEEHIQTIVGRYCPYNNVYAYDVVNEAILSDGSLRPNPWSGISDYIDKAFRTADDELNQCGRTDVKLYYNDYGIEYGRPDLFGNDYGMVFKRPGSQMVISPENNKTDAVYNYLANLILRPDPTPIDGIGFQTHLYMTDSYLPHDTDAMIATMNRFTTDLGLEVAITEMDVAIYSANPSSLYDEQATQFSGVAKACILAIRCTGYITWGVHDGTSWLESDRHPLMFYNAATQLFAPSVQQCVTPPGPPNAQYCPKPAYYAVHDVFMQAARLYLPAILKSNGSTTE